MGDHVFDRGIFMKSVKSRKMNLLAIKLVVGVTGVLMFAFQNCSRVDSLQISDVAGRAIGANEIGGNNNPDENVNVQIELTNGDVLTVDPIGNETVVNNNNSNNDDSSTNNTSTNESSNDSNTNGGGSSTQGQTGEQFVSDQSIAVAGEDEVKVEDVADLDVCVSEEQIKRHESHHNEKEHIGEHREKVKNTLASYKRIKCKTKKDKKHDRPRCLDLARENGMTVIDIAKMDDISLIKSIKGKTLIMTSDSSRSSVRSIMIENAVGKTIICGISIARLDVKKGHLEIREGASVKTCGEIKGRIYKDDRSSIDGSD